MRILTLLFLLSLFSCKQPKENSLFEPQVDKGTVDRKLREASGLVASRVNKGYLWSHNDSGNPPDIYLINDRAEIVKTFRLNKIVNRDWEDIAIETDAKTGINYLYIADIGDNNGKHSLKYLYRIQEPSLEDSLTTITQVDTCVIKLPDGPRDSEAITADPVTGNFYLFSKREPTAHLYEIRLSEKQDTLQVEKVSELPFSNVVAASISSDGQELLVKTYREIYYWKRNEAESIVETLKRKPISLNYRVESQGEAIAWDLEGNGFYTLSESKISGGTLYYYKRK